MLGPISSWTFCSFSMMAATVVSSSNDSRALRSPGMENCSMCSTTASGESMTMPSQTTCSTPVVAPLSLSDSNPRGPMLSGLVGIHWSSKHTPLFSSILR